MIEREKEQEPKTKKKINDGQTCGVVLEKVVVVVGGREGGEGVSKTTCR